MSFRDLTECTIFPIGEKLYILKEETLCISAFKMDDRTQKSIELLQKHLDAIASIRKQHPYSAMFIRWLQNVDIELARLFGENSGIYHNLKNISWRWVGSMVGHPFEEPEDVLTRYNEIAFKEGLNIAQGVLESAIDQLKQVGLEGIEKEKGYTAAGTDRRIFISHGKHTPALDKIERFLRSMGFTPVIVAREPSSGKSVDDLIEEQISGCLCAVILATSDDKVKDYYQPRPNVIHEIGLAQERLGNKVIYLKEEGCRFPSNVQPKVWEDFTQDNLEPAFEKIVKELRGFKLI